MTVAQIKKPKTSVPGQYLGYALQPVRLCFHLLDAPLDAQVSMEHLDDVAVHYADGTHLLEQTKSALSGNPASDRSVELWKAMANWADLCVASTVSPHSTRFRYYVTPSAGGALVKRLHSAHDKTVVVDLLKEIASAKIKGKPDSTAYPHIARFLAAGNEITHAAASPQFRGRTIYRHCTALQMPLEGRALPSHFIPGAFNCLADATRLGWHPDYKTLFPET